MEEDGESGAEEEDRRLPDPFFCPKMITDDDFRSITRSVCAQTDPASIRMSPILSMMACYVANCFEQCLVISPVVSVTIVKSVIAYSTTDILYSSDIMLFNQSRILLYTNQ